MKRSNAGRLRGPLFGLLLAVALSVAAPRPASTSPAVEEFPIATGSVEGQLTVGHPAFDGTNYLVGMRGNATDGMKVSAQLVSPSGMPVGPLISVPGTGGAPGALFTGVNYLLVWTDDGVNPPYQVIGQLISPAGEILGFPIQIGDTTGGQEFTGAAFDGTNVLVVWQCRDANGVCPGISGRLLDPSTGRLVGTEITISAAGKKDARVGFDGTNFLVVWFGAGANAGGVVGRFVGREGALVGDEFIVNASPAPSDNPGAVAFDGTNYMVLWNDEIGGQGTHAWDIYGQLVSKTGALVGSAFPVATQAGPQSFPYVFFDGDNYLATYTDLANDANHNFVCEAGESTCADVYGVRLSKSGAKINAAFPIAAGDGNQMIAPLRFAGGKYFVAWNSGVSADAQGELQGGDVYGTFLPGSVVACVGDCNGDGEVTVDELVLMVNIALNASAISACPAGDANGDGEVTVDEIIAAVNKALASC